MSTAEKSNLAAAVAHAASQPDGRSAPQALVDRAAGSAFPAWSADARIRLLRTADLSRGLGASEGGPPAWATAFDVWAPLSLTLAERVKKAPGFVQGITGPQGSGKSTLSKAVQTLARGLGVELGVLSIDDLYLGFEAREALRARVPELTFRGPPGTHDVELGIQTLDAVKAGKPVRLPRFDKGLRDGAGDRVDSAPPSHCDGLLFEGWMIGVRPLPDPSVLSSRLATFSNRALDAYLPLWARLDALWVLRPTEADASIGWRQRAEDERRRAGRGAMSDAQIEDFVRYFQRALPPELFMEPLRQLPLTDWTLHLDRTHRVVDVS